MNPLHLDAAPSATRARVVLRQSTIRGVDREAKMLRGLSAITAGEALGHGLWIDGVFLDQVAAAGTKMEKGAKARFTHPDMSSDGLGKFLGRASVFTREGNQVRVDLKMSSVAAKSPEGDLASYVLDLAEEDPQAFGASIVFDRDGKGESDFAASHLDPVGTFKSPDPENKKNLRHARLSSLCAVDLVDEPAANPRGLFSHPTFELLEGADAAAAFLLGLTEQVPPSGFGGVEPSRARAFVARFLEQRGLRVMGDNTMSTVPVASQTPLTPAPIAAVLASAALAATPEPARGPVAATLDELKKEFAGNPAFILEQLSARADLTSARAAWSQLRIAQLEAENATLRAGKASTTPVRGVEPTPFAPGPSASGGEDIRELARAYRDEKHPEFAGHAYKGMAEAMSVVTKQHKDAYSAYRQSNGIRNLPRSAR